MATKQVHAALAEARSPEDIAALMPFVLRTIAHGPATIDAVIEGMPNNIAGYVTGALFKHCSELPSHELPQYAPFISRLYKNLFPNVHDGLTLTPTEDGRVTTTHSVLGYATYHKPNSILVTPEFVNIFKGESFPFIAHVEWADWKDKDLAPLHALGLSHLRLTASQKAAGDLGRFFNQGWESLIYLDLSDTSTHLNSEDCAALANQSSLRSLRILDLAHSNVGDSSASVILESPVFKLEAVSFKSNRLTDQGVATLANSPRASTLEYLDLSSNVEASPLGPNAASALCSSENLPNLRTLILNYTHMGDEGAKVFAGENHLQRLEALGLSGCNIGPIGAAELAQATRLNLTALNLYLNLIGPEAAAAIKARFGAAISPLCERTH